MTFNFDRFLLGVAALAAAIGTGSLHGQPVRLYLANDDHTDYLWTADAGTYNAVFVDMLEYYLRLADETKENPPPYRSRFNADGAYWLWQFEHRKSPEDFAHLMTQLKDGTISAPMTTLVSCYGAQPAEAVLRGLLYAGRLERRFGLRFSMAVAMENQTLPLGLASLWAGAGARYSWRGVCACASRLPNAALQRRPHEIYWCAGLDGQRVLMKWHSLAAAGNRHSGGYAEAFDPVLAVKSLEMDADFLQRYCPPGTSQPYAVRAAFGFGWDALDRKTGQPYRANEKDYPVTDHFHNIARNLSTPALQVIVSNEEDFFRDFEACYGAQLPTECVTYGNEWDLYSASMAETSARVKRAVEKLRAAELMATLVSLQDNRFLQGRIEARDLAFTNLGLYWEHDWTADGPVPRADRAAWQQLLASQIEFYVDSLHADAARQLGSLIQNPDAGELRCYALNPLGWARTDHADLAYNGSHDVHVRDVSTGRDVPHQFIELSGKTYLRFLATDVPSAGYKVYAIVPGAGDAPADPAARFDSGKGTLENSRVKVAAEPDGAIASLIDQAWPQVELAATIDGLKLNDLSGAQPAGERVVVENSGPVSVTLRCQSNVPRQHTTRITLFRDSNRVDIRNEITENFGELRHWAFSFNLASPDVHAEEIGAVIRVKRKADGGDYADSHARCDYATLNHFADITDGANTHGVTLANSDCAFARLGHSTPSTLDTATAQINVLAGGQVDGPGLGIPNQSGAAHFLQRFALYPHAAYDAAAAMKAGLEHQNPLVTGFVDGAASAPYSPTSFALLTLDDPRVLLWAVKPHEDGIDRGVIARVWNQSAEASVLRIETGLPLASAQQVSHLETPRQDLPARQLGFETVVAGRRIETFRLVLIR